MEENHIIPQLDAKKWSLIAGSGSLQNGLRRLGDHPGCFRKCSLSSTGKKAHTAIHYPVRDHRPSGPELPDLWTRKVFDPTALSSQSSKPCRRPDYGAYGPVCERNLPLLFPTAFGVQPGSI
ncbi:hypothetical protein [Rhizobium giardinii]|uniref:Uncharacterized protein n=1 Tax=Rhizobium giardinii TaxID=56731 RepID=A0A7W8XAJ2_9HYPH|nr:hypothetical protein [Rhizobium giardinii]MBB5537741.1 hypothetical protein [Rhizobium giardinii]